jgi:hypothetical protein
MLKLTLKELQNVLKENVWLMLKPLTVDTYASIHLPEPFRFDWDYVLAGYGTGAVMAVPCGDERDYALLISLKDRRNAGNQNIFC